MKKRIITLLILAMSLTLTACTNPFNKGEDTQEAVQLPADDMTQETTEEGTEIELNVSEEDATQEATTEEVVKEDSKKKSFKEEHPYLFAFRFDGTTAYIDDASYIAPESSGNAGTTAQDTVDSYTDVTADTLPQTIRFVNSLPGYNLTTARNNGFALYESSDGRKVKVEPLSKDEFGKRKETLPSTSEFTDYKFTKDEFVFAKDKFESADLIKIKYTLRDGTEGEMPWALACYLENGSVIFITNNSMTKEQNDTSLTAVFKNCINWVEE